MQCTSCIVTIPHFQVFHSHVIIIPSFLIYASVSKTDASDRISVYTGYTWSLKWILVGFGEPLSLVFYVSTSFLFKIVQWLNGQFVASPEFCRLIMPPFSASVSFDPYRGVVGLWAVPNWYDTMSLLLLSTWPVDQRHFFNDGSLDAVSLSFLKDYKIESIITNCININL